MENVPEEGWDRAGTQKINNIYTNRNEGGLLGGRQRRSKGPGET